MAPTTSSSSHGAWSRSMAWAGQAVSQRRQSAQPPQARQRRASATASSSPDPRRTSARVWRARPPARGASADGGPARRRGGRRQPPRRGPARGSQTRPSPRRAGSCGSRRRRAPAGRDRLDGVAAPVAAASPAANTPLRSVIRCPVDDDLAASQRTPVRPPGTPRQTIAGRPPGRRGPRRTRPPRRSPAAPEPHRGDGVRARRAQAATRVGVGDLDPLLAGHLPRAPTAPGAGGILGADEGHRLRAETQAAAGGVEGDVAAPDDHNRRPSPSAGPEPVTATARPPRRCRAGPARRTAPTCPLQPDGEEHRLVAGIEQGIHGEVRAAPRPGAELDPVGEHAADLPGEELAGQAELRDEIAQRAARLGLGLEDRDVVAEPGELTRRGQARRAGAHDGRLLGVHGRRRHDRWGRRHPVGDESADPRDRDGIVHATARALRLASRGDRSDRRRWGRGSPGSPVRTPRRCVPGRRAPGNPGPRCAPGRPTCRAPSRVVDRECRRDGVGERPADRLALGHAEVEGALQLDGAAAVRLPQATQRSLTKLGRWSTAPAAPRAVRSRRSPPPACARGCASPGACFASRGASEHIAQSSVGKVFDRRAM